MGKYKKRQWALPPAFVNGAYTHIIIQSSSSDGIAAPRLGGRIEFLHCPPNLQWCRITSGCGGRREPINGVDSCTARCRCSHQALTFELECAKLTYLPDVHVCVAKDIGRSGIRIRESCVLNVSRNLNPSRYHA